MRTAGILLPILLLAGCSSASDEPSTVTADENRRLNEAAAMLDANSIELNALDDADPAEADPAENVE